MRLRDLLSTLALGALQALIGMAAVVAVLMTGGA